MNMNRNFSLPDIKAGLQESSFLNTTEAGTSHKSSAKRTLKLLETDDKLTSPYYFTSNTPQQQNIPSMQNTRDFLQRKQSSTYNLNHQLISPKVQYLQYQSKQSEYQQSPKLLFQPSSAVKFRHVPDSRDNSERQTVQSKNLQRRITPSKRYQQYTTENSPKNQVLNAYLEDSEEEEELNIFAASKNQRKLMFDKHRSEGLSAKRRSTPGYVGVESMQFFYKKFQKLENEVQKVENSQSATTAYLKQVKKLNLLPQPLGLMSHTGRQHELKASNMKLGRNYAIALSKSMKILKDTQYIEMPGNRLGRQGGEAILQNLTSNIKTINLDNNKIGKEAMCNLVKWIDSQNRQCQLEELSLMNNLLDDSFISDLAHSLTHSLPPLHTFNLSRNQISDKGAQSLADFLHNQYQLKTFKISWNKIKGKGGIYLAQAIKECQKLMVFDASFNMFGSIKNGQFGQAMAEAVNKGYLRHLDISYNSMDKNECEIFGKAIFDNHTLWGLHILGNDCILDSMGFVRPGLKQKIQTRDILYSPVRDGQNIQLLKNNPKYAKVMSYQKCWICEEPAYIHFDFDEYMPWLMNKDEEEGSYFIWKMVPPGQSNYFYSFGGDKGEAEVAKDQPHHKAQTIKHIKDVVFIPRLSGSLYVRPFYIKPRTPWTRPISLFRDYQVDTEEILDECFENDWSNMKVPKMTEEERIEVKVELRKAYRIIYLASIGSSGQVFSILLNCYTDFVRTVGILDGKVISMVVSDTEFYSINKRTKASPVNPGQALIRFQFVEILLRLAIKKYEQTGEAKSKADALKMLYERNLLPKYGHIDPQSWRDDRYWNEEVDNLYKSHFPIFEILFKSFGSHYLKPSDKPFMMVDEFETFAYAAGLITDSFGTRECAAQFSLSIQTSTDELNNDRHLKAHFAEFIEAFARVCERLSIAQPYDEEAGELPMTNQERQDQPLHIKILNILPQVVNKTMTEKFIEKWKWPKRDTETGLFKDIYFRRNKKDPDSLADFGLSPIKDAPKTIFEL